MPPFDREFFGGKDRLELDAGNIFGLVMALDAIAPGFAESAEMRASFAIDGAVTPNWSSSLAGVGEVIVLPRVSGG